MTQVHFQSPPLLSKVEEVRPLARSCLTQSVGRTWGSFATGLDLPEAVRGERRGLASGRGWRGGGGILTSPWAQK